MISRHTTPLLALFASSFLGCQPASDEDGASPDAATPGGKADSFEDDDRTRVLDSTDPRAADWAASVAILSSRISADGTADVPTLEERFDLCAGERFASDPFLGHCSAFLVGPDLVATAAHCLEQHGCEDTRIVFGFNDAERNDDLSSLDPEELYRCTETFVAEQDDVALIRLDRVVQGRVPLQPAEGFEGQRVALVGHPLGGRATVDLSGVIQTWDERRLSTTLDTFSGHSGAPVLSLDSGQVVAVHTSGAGYNLTQASGGSCSSLKECRPTEFVSCLAGATNVALLPFDDAEG